MEVLTMSSSNFFNLEILALEIADEHINKMTDYCHKDFMVNDDGDFAPLHNNIKNGWIVVVMLNNYIESVVNSILRDCICYRSKKIINLESKIKILYVHFKADIASLKKMHCWENFNQVKRMRNKLVHYENNYMGEGHGMAILDDRFESMFELFKLSKMKKMKVEIINLCDKIVSDCDLTINQWANLLACEARDGLVSFVYDPKNVYIDESRFDDPPSDEYLKYVRNKVE